MTYQMERLWAENQMTEQGMIRRLIINKGEIAMSGWNPDVAADALSKRDYQCHYRKTKTANFRFKGPQSREISIALGRLNGVTAYVNLQSTGGLPFPENGIEGIEIVQKYSRGYEGINGNPGISVSVARTNPSLDPASNDVLRIHVRDDASLDRLLAWYAGK